MSHLFDTGALLALQEAIDALPAKETARFRAITVDYATRMRDRARELLLAQIVGTTDHPTANAIEVVIEDDRQQVHIQSASPSQYPANLVLWLEHGTSHQAPRRHQAPRPYMRPSFNEVSPAHTEALARASEELMREAFGD